MTTPDAFRAEVRQWLKDNCPASIRTPAPAEETVWGGRRETFRNPDARLWLERMAEQGWTCPTWPTEYGGGGLCADQSKVLTEELHRIGARQPLSSFGIWMLGPVLLEFGDEAQKREHLPKIVRGEIRWCQGYSEPGAGSDLAGLQTRAEDRGDHYRVNGSKIWTSFADQADWIFCLVRTDTGAPKHEGISFLLFDMESPGVSTSPIRLLSGSSPFCQTFFDNVEVPKANLVGEPGQGWSIAKRLLQHERQMISGIGGNSALGGAGRPLYDVVRDYIGSADIGSADAGSADAGGDGGRIRDGVVRDKVVAHRINDRAFQLTLSRARDEARAGQADGNLSSMFKYYGSEQNKRKFELLLETMGTGALGWEGDAFEAAELDTTRQWLRSKGNSIEGGTSEVQLNVIAKRVLGLPD